MTGTIQIVTAAAGAGKTTRIVGDIAVDVATRAPEEVLATTFTIRAADELVQRARTELFRQGRVDLAGRLLGARFGTVNAVCGQIVGEFALELGRSTSTSVIADTQEPLVFAIAADAAIGAHAPILNDLAEMFGHDDPHPPGRDPPDWRKTVRSILTLARANGLAADGLAVSADRSVASYLALFSPPAESAADLDAALAAALADAIAQAPAAPSATAVTGGIDRIRAAHTRAARGEPLTWSTWAGLCKVKCAPTKDGRAYQQALQTLAAAAGRHGEHPQLRADGVRFIREIFQCAAQALEAYEAHKAERGLVDFTDQEALALRVLRDRELAGRLQERISRVFVDEFQDSSPLQLAVFTALAEIADASTWVGDPKQAIYAFRGADTDLTQAAFAGAAAAGEGDVLSVSWRSRPDIVRLANAAFGPAFARMGLPPERHAFSRAARTDIGFDRGALGYWPLIGKANEQAAALARGVRDVLADGGTWTVEPPSDDHRPLRVGDIAVLCRTNTDVERFAAALSREGLPVAVERQGLARTPHVELALAAYRWIADPSDRLALAEMARFFGDDPESDAWLQAAAEEGDDRLLAEVPIAPALATIRADILALTPAEALDAILALPDVMARIEGWGDQAIRLDDLEALRGFARTYEAECVSSGAPATPSGLLLALKSADPERPPSLSQYLGAKILGGGSVGSWRDAVTLISELLSRDAPNLMLSPASGGGGGQNLEDLDRGLGTYALTTASSLHDARAGLSPFRRRHESLRTVMNLADLQLLIISREEITGDLPEALSQLRVSPGERGFSAARLFEQLLGSSRVGHAGSAGGGETLFFDYPEGRRQFLAGRVDVLFWLSAVNSTAVQSLAEMSRTTLNCLHQSDIDRVIAGQPGLRSGMISSARYPGWLVADRPTLIVPTVVASRSRRMLAWRPTRPWPSGETASCISGRGPRRHFS